MEMILFRRSQYKIKHSVFIKFQIDHTWLLDIFHLVTWIDYSSLVGVPLLCMLQSALYKVDKQSLNQSFLS